MHTYAPIESHVCMSLFLHRVFDLGILNRAGWGRGRRRSGPAGHTAAVKRCARGCRHTFAAAMPWCTGPCLACQGLPPGGRPTVLSRGVSDVLMLAITVAADAVTLLMLLVVATANDSCMHSQRLLL